MCHVTCGDSTQPPAGGSKGICCGATLKVTVVWYGMVWYDTGVCIVLAAGSEIQANLKFNIFSFLPFVPFAGGAL